MSIMASRKKICLIIYYFTDMKEKIIEILGDLRPEFDFTQTGVNFIEEGMLDSFDMVALVSDLENQFDIKIDGVDVVPENFGTIEAIENMLRKNGVQ